MVARKAVLRIFKITGFLVLLLVAIVIAGKIVAPKWLDSKNNLTGYIVRGFKNEKENSLDVMFMGNSDVYRGISPMELWNEHGIASYSYTAPSERMWTGYYLFLDALRKQKPKVIFFNADGLFNNSHTMAANYQKALVNMEFSDVKVDAVRNEMIQEGMRIHKKNTMSLVFPILEFHSRATSLKEGEKLKKEDFKEALGSLHFPYKGFDMCFDAKPNKKGYSYMNKKHSNSKSFPKKASLYMDKIVKLCKDNSIELVLTELPSADSWDLEKSQKTAEYAKKNGLKFIDFNFEDINKEIGFDWLKDTADGGDHLNVNGAIKMSEYIGKFIKENYDVPDHRKDKEYASWNDDYKIYEKSIKERRVILSKK